LSPNTSCNLPKSSTGNAIGFLFGLAPSGVFPAIYVAINAVRSYRTISPLPRVCINLGGIFSVALSVGSRLPGITWHFYPMEPGLSSPRLNGATVWPTLGT